MPGKYFSDEELACKCGCGLLPKQRTIDIADKLRVLWGAGLRVTSGARCQNYNNYLRLHGIPAAQYSAHIEGLALDLRPLNGKVRELQELAIQNAERLGIRVEDPKATPQWLHFDLRPVAPGKNRVFKP